MPGQPRTERDSPAERILRESLNGPSGPRKTTFEPPAKHKRDGCARYSVRKRRLIYDRP